MSLFQWLRPLIFALESESAHGASIRALSLLRPRAVKASPDILRSEVAGLTFPNPVGLAAGYDKDAMVPVQMLGLGFGSVEIGTLTPLPQAGNPRPRLFRLVEDEAVINRMGFNNSGLASALPRLEQAQGVGIIGVNIGANKDSVDRPADYAAGVRAMRGVASYLTVNISSPNTPGLRALQGGEALDDLLDVVTEARGVGGPPVFLKVAPDLTSEEIDAVARVAMGRIDALIISNTTISRPPLSSKHADEAGGLSGAPLRDLAQRRLVDFRKATGGKMPLIGVGGIASAADAYARIRAGASLVQIYSALVYEGPGLATRINIGLAEMLRRDGFLHLGDAVGVDAR
jgi:dihydroorotate dehydrogenase